MKVLSLFDGISCGMVALKKLDIPVERYVAYEIDETAIKISQKNWSQIEQQGNVIGADFAQYKGFELLLGGSPCQDLSIIKTGRSGLEGAKSSLFWEYKRALDEVQPRWFLFENVASMKDLDKKIISDALGVQPVMINADNWLPQNRERLYWTNIPIAPISADCAKLKDLLEDTKEGVYKKPFTITDLDKNIIGTIQLNTYEANRRVFGENSIIGCLTCVSGGYQEKKIYIEKYNFVRKLTPVEYERLQGLADNYTFGFSRTKRYTACGNGWCVPVIEHIFKGLEV